MAGLRYVLCVPLIAALSLGGGGLHAVLDATGGCGHDHARPADPQESPSAGHSCGHDHCVAAQNADPTEGQPSDENRPHDDSSCVVCVWAASGVIYQFHEVGVRL